MENLNIKKWYKKEYPDDNEAKELKNDTTFKGLFEALDSYKNVYNYLGDGIDSVIRERCFQKLAEIMQVEYSYIYDQWLLCIED